MVSGGAGRGALCRGLQAHEQLPLRGEACCHGRGLHLGHGAHLRHSASVRMVPVNEENPYTQNMLTFGSENMKRENKINNTYILFFLRLLINYAF